MITIDLPKPISTNKLFKNKRSGRSCTQEYNTWKWWAKAAIQKQKPISRPNGPISLHFAVGEVGVSPRMDGDNCLKCLIDALVDNGVIADDNRQNVRSVGMSRVEGKEGVTAYLSAAQEFSEVLMRGVVS